MFLSIIPASGAADFLTRLAESERFHMGQGEVRKTLVALAEEFNRLRIDYGVIGAMALNAHGFARETTDVDVLVRQEGLCAFVDACVGRGYLPAFPGARKSFRDTRTGIKVEFLTTGEFPGDGKPKPIAFPDPAAVAVSADGVSVVALPTLVELKLASGMTQPSRRRDLADVQDLIRVLRLDADFGRTLHPYVQPMYQTLLDELKIADPHAESEPR